MKHKVKLMNANIRIGNSAPEHPLWYDEVLQAGGFLQRLAGGKRSATTGKWAAHVVLSRRDYSRRIARYSAKTDSPNRCNPFGIFCTTRAVYRWWRCAYHRLIASNPSGMNLLVRFATVCFALLITLGSSLEAAQRPNFVFLFTDDQRFDAVGVVQREQGEAARFPWLQTPNLDRLATEGLRFRNAFVVNSLCSPSRACVLSGRYSHHNGIVNNHTPLNIEQTLFPKLLREAGYATAYCGKFHMGQQRERPGFDYVASFIGQGRYYDCPLLVNGVQTPTTGFVDDVTTDYAIEFIKQRGKEKEQEKPFLLWLGFKSPHGPLGAPEKFKELYSNETAKRPANADVAPPFPKQAAGKKAKKKAGSPAPAQNNHHEYMRHITAVDENVGRLLAALKEAGLEENTVVIHTSDNGFYLGEHTLGDKRSAYDESLRVPLLVRWPKLAGSPGRVIDDMVLNIDFAPTMLDLAGVAIPPEIQGRSLKPLLEDKSPADWRRSYFYEYFYENNFFSPTVTAVRTETHKLILYPGHEDWTELFDLQADRFEMHNLARDAQHAKLLQKMQAEHDRLAQQVGYHVPSYADQPPK